jgi:branched-chain amino acid transport system substrate-binding protein
MRGWSMRNRGLVVALASVVGLVAAACGGDDGATGASSTDESTAEAASQPSGTPIKLGVLLSLSGPAASLGPDVLEGVRVGVEAVNASGGVLGRPLEIVEADTKSNPEESVAATTRFIQDPEIVTMIGPDIGFTVLPVLPLAIREEFPVVSVSGGVVGAVPDDQLEYTWFVGPGFVKSLAPFLPYWQEQGYSDIAVIGEEGPLFTIITEAMDAQADDFGLDVSADSFPSGQPDITPILSRHRDADAILAPCNGANCATILRNMRSLDIDAEFVTHIGNATENAIELAGGDDVVEGALYNGWRALVVDELEAGEQKAQIQRYLDAMEQADPSFDRASSAILGWDAVQAVAHALEEAGEVDRVAFRDALQNQSFVGAVTEWNKGPEDHEGAATDTYVVVRRTSGGWELVSGLAD